MKKEPNGLPEFISRPGRMKILEMLIHELSSTPRVSRALQLHRSTVSGWTNEKDRHPSNTSTEKMLDLAWKRNPRETRKILVKELEAFKSAFDSFVCRGANNRTTARRTDEKNISKGIRLLTLSK